MHRVFIAGATGVLGKRVVRLLVNRGVPVTALSRSRENDEMIRHMGADPVHADLFNARDMVDNFKEQ